MHNLTDPFAEESDEEISLRTSTVPIFDNDDDPANWQDHIIICGLHELGFRILEQLQAVGVQVVVIDDKPDPRLGRRLQRMGVKFIQDDSRVPDTLIEAGIYNASAIIAC